MTAIIVGGWKAEGVDGAHRHCRVSSWFSRQVRSINEPDLADIPSESCMLISSHDVTTHDDLAPTKMRIVQKRV